MCSFKRLKAKQIKQNKYLKINRKEIMRITIKENIFNNWQNKIHTSCSKNKHQVNAK